MITGDLPQDRIMLQW